MPTPRLSTRLTLSAATTNAIRGQEISLTGELMAWSVEFGPWGRLQPVAEPLAVAAIEFYILRYVKGEPSFWRTGPTVYTDNSGKYSYNFASDTPETIQFKAVYAGDSGDMGSTSSVVRATWWTNIPTTLTLEPLYNYVVGEEGGTAQVKGSLTDVFGNGIANKSIFITSLYYTATDPNVGTNTQASVATDSQGIFKDVWVHTFSAPTGYADFQAHFSGDGTYGPSESNIVNPAA